MPTNHILRTTLQNKPAREVGKGQEAEEGIYDLLKKESELEGEYQDEEDEVYHILAEAEEGKEMEDDQCHTYEVLESNSSRKGRVEKFYNFSTNS